MPRVAYAAVAVAVAYYLGARVGFALTPNPQPVSTLWPPNAILLGALLLAPRRVWPALLLAALPAHLAAELGSGVPLPMVVCWYVSNSSEALIGAMAMRRLGDGSVRLDSFRQVGIFLIFGAFLAPFLASFLDAAFVAANHWGTSGYWEVWRVRLFSNVLANLIFVPVIVSWRNQDIHSLRATPAPRVLEATALAVSLIVVCIVVFERSPATMYAVPALLCIPLPFLLWAAVRFGPAGASTCLLAFAALSVWGAIHGRGPFIGRSVEENILSLQLFLIVTYVPLMALAGVLRERVRAEAARRDEAALRESALRLRELADAMPQIVFTASPDGRIDYFNRRWYRYTGTFEKPIDEWTDALHPDDREAAVATWVDDVAVGRPHEHEGRFWSAETGTFRWHLCRALPVRDEAGTILRWYGTATDIDDHKQIEEAMRDSESRLRASGEWLEHTIADRTRELRSSEERFAKAFRASPNAISITRQPDERLIEVNERWETLFGYTQAEVIGKTVQELGICCGKEDKARYRDALAANGFVRELEVDMRDRAGAVLHAVISSESVDVGGEPCVITMVRDITERRQAEHELAEQRRQLAHLGRVAVLGELSGALAHELNQPLTAILANARAAQRMLLRDRPDVAEVRTILGDIAADDLRAGAVIRRMRALIRKGDAEPQPVLINELVNEVLDLAHSDLLLRGVSLVTRLATSLPAITADRIQLQQVVLNLVVNACDAMAENLSSDRSLTIVTAEESGGVRVSVSDRGTGISGDCVDSVFEPFFTSKEHGLGLGLSICRSIVNAHGGRMWAVNNPDRGATFHLVLPIGADAEPQGRTVQYDPRRASTPA